MPTENFITIPNLEASTSILLEDLLLTANTLPYSSIVPENLQPINVLLDDVEIPVHDNLLVTVVEFNDNSLSNSGILDEYETIPIVPPIPPGDGSVFPEDPDLLPKIYNTAELLPLLSELMIRFSSNPNYYMQDDFRLLIQIVTNSLIYLYSVDTGEGQIAALWEALALKVDKVAGKGLSTNDLTDTLKGFYDTAYGWGNHAGLYEAKNTNIQLHISSTSNPHNVTKAQVGLTNVTDNAQWYADNHPTTTSGYGLPDYPTTLPASDVYMWAKAANKPFYTTTEVSEGDNLYYTEVRVAANSAVVANTAKVSFPGFGTSHILAAYGDHTHSIYQLLLNGTGFVKSTAGTISYDTNTYYNSSNPSNFIALTALSSSATGLTYTNTTGVFSLTTGYVIPTTTEQTNWGTAYTNRITSLTVTGSSGAATLISNTLNIPTYTLSGLGGQPSNTNLTSLAELVFASTAFVKMTAAGTFGLDTNTYYNSTNPSSFIALTALSSSATGLTYTNTTGVFSLTSGYVIPTTTQETNWGTAYTNRITSLTVTGSSGAATLVTNTLNIPTYTLAGLGGIAKAGDTGIGNLNFTGNSVIDVVATAGIDVINLGTGNADIINIGWSGSTININGTLSYQAVDNLTVKDKLITLNKGGGVSSGVSSGFEIEEDSLIKGWFTTSAGRTGWEFRSPAIAFSAILSQANQTAERTYTLQNLSGTLAFTSDLHNAVTLATNSGLEISTQVLNMGTPSTITGSTTNSVTTNTHTHAVSGFATTIHNLVDTTNHPVAGLTTGHFLKATGATSYGFVAHGLTYSDVAALPFQIATDTNFTTGFVNSYSTFGTVDTTLSFNTTTKVFTIAPTGASFQFYVAGTLYTKLAADTQSVDLSVGWANNTLYFIYYNSAGVLSKSTSAWNISGNAAPVATVVWNGTSANAVIGEERHSARRNNSWHEWAHNTIGTKIKQGGFALSSITSSATTIESGVLCDEDINNPIGQQVDSIRLAYTLGGATTYADTLSATTSMIIGGVLKYDNLGTITSVSDGYFVRNVILVSNSLWGPIVCRIAQTQWININDARNSNVPVFTSYLSAETREVYSVIWQNVGGTPTFVEYVDFREAPTLPNGFVSKTPMYLDTLIDVSASTPQVDEIIKWNGANWVNGAPITASASAGIEFFPDTTKIITLSNQNLFPLETLNKFPVTTTEVVEAIACVNNSVIASAYLYNLALGRTTIDAGNWAFDFYLSVSSIGGGRVSTLTNTIFEVLPYSPTTVTTTGSSTTRTLTASGGTPFATGKITASTDPRLSGYVQTPKGLYQVVALISDTQVTIQVPTTYTNETTVAYSVWKRLFGATSPTITALTTNYALYTIQTSQSAYTISSTSKLGMLVVGTSNNTTTVNYVYNGSARYSHFSTPLITLHNNLAGLQGGVTNEFYHLTSLEYTGSGTGVFARVASPIFTTPNIGSATGSASLNLLLTGGTLTGNLLFSTDNTLDIGANAATRPRTGYFGTSVIAPNFTGVASKATNLVGGNSTTLLGLIPYQSNTDVTSLLSPNTTIVKKWLNQTGTGTNGAAPIWSAISQSDISLLNDAWLTTFDYAGNPANLIKLSKDNLVTFGNELDLNHLYHVTNAGLNNIVKIPITAQSVSGTEHGVAIKLGVNKIFKVSTLSDGTGSVAGTNTSVLKGNFTVSEGNVVMSAGDILLSATSSVISLNDKWALQSYDYVGGLANILKLSKDNIIEFGKPVGINSFYDTINTELHDIVSIPINSSSPSGTVHGVSITVGGLKLLEVAGTSSGSGGLTGGYIIIPKMTTSQMNAIISPSEGMLIYNTTTHSLYDFDGTSWAAV